MSHAQPPLTDGTLISSQKSTDFAVRGKNVSDNMPTRSVDVAKASRVIPGGPLIGALTWPVVQILG